MKPSVLAEISRLGQLTVNQLTRRYEEVAGEPCRNRHKQYLVRRVAWLLQAKAEGGLTERARRRAEELANVADVRTTPPRAPHSAAKTPRIVADHAPRLPPPGNWIERSYKGRQVRVLVLPDGFEFEGARYRSLSAIAKRVRQQLRRLCTTGYDLGSHVNRSRNRLLHEAAMHYFGSWRGALSASGINLANVSRRRPKHLDREVMILWLQQRQAAGQSLRWTVVCLENRDYALAIRRVFRSWRDAIDAAGVREDKKARWR